MTPHSRCTTATRACSPATSRHFTKFNIGDVYPIEVMEAEEEETHDHASMEANQKVAIESSDFF